MFRADTTCTQPHTRNALHRWQTLPLEVCCIQMEIAEPIFEYVPFRVVVRVVEKQNTPLHLHMWEAVTKTDKWIQQLDPLTVEDDRKKSRSGAYLAVKHGTTHFTVEATAKSWPTVVRLTQSLTIHPIPFKLQAISLTVNGLPVSIEHSTLSLGSLVNFLIEIRDQNDQVVRVDEKHTQWWSIESTFSSPGSETSVQTEEIRGGLLNRSISVKMKSSKEVLIVYHRARLHTKENNAVRDLRILRQAFRVSNTPGILPEEKRIRRMSFSIPTTGGVLVGAEEKLRSAVQNTMISNFPFVKICGLEVDTGK
ncbi:unnamed protein product [Echinostoma caproni]|uniref:Mannosidase_ig domain-containing protein n=1 Tax=Echinostoma caproni TaxID=27848 RepID=A0A183AG88_9TREM|nr:unnamed protein product [Echinostoma caproni]